MKPIPVLVTEDGLHARAVNPYPDFTSNKERLTVKTYDLTHYCTPGSVINVKLVWQYQSKSLLRNNHKKWFIVEEYIYLNTYKESTYNTRQAYQPIPITDADKIVSGKEIDFAEFQVQLRCCLIIKDGFDNEWMHDFYADYKEDFGIKIPVKEWAEDFFQDVTLDTHSYCLVSKLAEINSDKSKESYRESVRQEAEQNMLRHNQVHKQRTFKCVSQLNGFTIGKQYKERIDVSGSGCFYDDDGMSHWIAEPVIKECFELIEHLPKEETVEEAAEKMSKMTAPFKTERERLIYVDGIITGSNWQKQQSINQYNKAIEDVIYIIKERMFLIDSYILSGKKNHDEFDFTAELTDLINNVNNLKTK